MTASNPRKRQLRGGDGRPRRSHWPAGDLDRGFIDRSVEVEHVGRDHESILGRSERASTCSRVGDIEKTNLAELADGSCDRVLGHCDVCGEISDRYRHGRFFGGACRAGQQGFETTHVEGLSARRKCAAAGSTSNDRRVVSSLATAVPGVNRSSAKTYNLARGGKLEECPAGNA